MSIQLPSKINLLLQHWPTGTVALTSWLEGQGISRQLQARYRRSGWVEALGKGAVKRAGDIVEWPGALYAVQHHAGLSIHVGGVASLALQGLAHYFAEDAFIQLFGDEGVSLPKWFLGNQWGVKVEYYRTGFVPAGLGLQDYEQNRIRVRVSSPERAILECLYLTPQRMDMLECYQIMEGLVNLRPALMQQLLEQCHSVKVKRLFFYMASKFLPEWLQFLNPNVIDMGHGKRSLVKGGVLIPHYNITVPKALADY